MRNLNSLPSVERVLQSDAAAGLSKSFGRPLTLQAVRATLDLWRQGANSTGPDNEPSISSILDQTRELLTAWTRPVCGR